MINAYLYQVYLEDKKEDIYKFNKAKINPLNIRKRGTVTKWQLEFEFSHLLKKLEKRDKKKFEELKNLKLENIEPNPIFKVVNGGVEDWEK